MFSVTPSKLNDYLICPLKFKFKHPDKHSEIGSSAASSFGTSMHRALQKLHSQKNFDSKNINPSKLLENHWEKSAYPTIEEEKEYFAKGCRALENYIAQAKQTSEQTLATETYLSLVINVGNTKMRLGCRIDRLVLHDDGSLEIIDFKTNKSGKVPTSESLVNDLPAFLYFILTRISYAQHSKIKLTYLNILTLEKSSVTYGKEVIDKNKQTLWNCLKEIVGNNYLPILSENCCWCDFQDRCPKTGKIVDFEDL